MKINTHTHTHTHTKLTFWERKAQWDPFVFLGFTRLKTALYYVCVDLKKCTYMYMKLYTLIHIGLINSCCMYSAMMTMWIGQCMHTCNMHYIYTCTLLCLSLMLLVGGCLLSRTRTVSFFIPLTGRSLTICCRDNDKTTQQTWHIALEKHKAK